MYKRSCRMPMVSEALHTVRQLLLTSLKAQSVGLSTTAKYLIWRCSPLAVLYFMLHNLTT
jgi:hypothetical protein